MCERRWRWTWTFVDIWVETAMEIYPKSPRLSKLLSYTLGSANSLTNLGLIALPHCSSSDSQSVSTYLPFKPSLWVITAVLYCLGKWQIEASVFLPNPICCVVFHFCDPVYLDELLISVCTLDHSILEQRLLFQRESVDGIPRYGHYRSKKKIILLGLHG